MHISAEAIVCAVRAHGEHGAIARVLTPADGLIAGYVRGGRSRRMRPVLLAGNTVLADLRARTDAQLPALTVELVESRAPLLAEPLAAAAIDWSTALAAATLPEGQAYPAIHAALDGLLAAIVAAPAARGWATALVRYELLLLAELGFGLDLSQCVATGVRDDLGFVSPKSGGAVSRTAAVGHEGRLMPLPPFLHDGAPAGWDDIVAGLRITGRFLARDLLGDGRARLLPARERLVDRITRLAG